MEKASSSRKSASGKVVPRISVIGGFQLSVGRAIIDVRSKKAQALLAYLMISPLGSETRERLCGLLWSEFSEARARGSLRQILHGLRTIFDKHGYTGFVIDRDHVKLDRSTISFDLGELYAALDRHEVPDRLVTSEDLSAQFLAGFDGVDGGFDVFLAIHRSHVKERLERGLNECLDRVANEETRIAAAIALLNIDRSNEHATRGLMMAHAARGELPAALKVYKQLWDYLDAEFDMEPSKETQALAAQLKAEESAASRKARVPAAGLVLQPTERQAIVVKPTQRAVVIAPFDSSGVHKDYIYLVAGLRQELISKLLRFREWVIIDGSAIKPEARAKFESRWPEHVWIDAMVLQAGPQLKITISVREQPIANLIWSDSFLFDLNNWFDIERKLLARIAATMNLHISTARLVASSGAPEMSLEIYDRWLRGQSIIMSWRPEREKAAELYREILAEAPNFSPAYSSLAQLTSAEHIAFPGVFRTEEREKAGLAYARQAVRCDPFDARAHLALGWASAMNGQFDQSYSAFQTAVELNANDLWTLNSAGIGIALCGDTQRALEIIQHSLSLGLQPSNYHLAYQGPVHFLAGDYERACDVLAKASSVMEVIPAWQAAALIQLGRLNEARSAIRAFIDQTRSRWSGSSTPSEPTIASWFLQCFPLRDRSAWLKLRDSLVASGIAVPPEDEIPRHP